MDVTTSGAADRLRSLPIGRATAAGQAHPGTAGKHIGKQPNGNGPPAALAGGP